MTEHWYRIYTDLDGTLLDHHTYDWTPAADAIRAVLAQRVLIIPSTSKTAEELDLWLATLGLPGYGVVENGGMVLLPKQHPYWQTKPPDWIGHNADGLLLSRPYGAVCQWLDDMRSQKAFQFQGFHDVDLATVMAWTGMPEVEALASLDRHCAEPIQWQGDASSKAEFKALAQQAGWAVTEGGRFLHVGSQVDKVQGVLWLESHLPEPGHWLALGDGENDRSMLAQADRAAIIPKPDGTHLDLDRTDAYRAQHPGPQGWAEAVTHWLADWPRMASHNKHA
jgi:mannosyl-3-phosphoglycerate phosphatase family protein